MREKAVSRELRRCFLPSLSESNDGPQRPCPGWSSALRVSRRRSTEPGGSPFSGLLRRRARDHSAGLSGTRQLARTPARLRRFAYKGLWLAPKKALSLPPLASLLRPPRAEEPLVLEWDELWSFVGRKARVAGVWVALDRAKRPVVACVLGDRSAATCRALWEQVPAPCGAWQPATRTSGKHTRP